MKYILSLIAMCLVIIPDLQLQAQTSQLKMGDYTISAAVSPKKEGGAVNFVTASFTKSAKGAKGFGLFYAQNENAMSDVVLEISDAATKAIIKNITAADIAGASKTEVQNKGAKNVSTYQFGAGVDMLELQVTTESLNDDTAPLGKKMIITYKVRLTKDSQVNAVLRLKTDGSAQRVGTAGFYASRMENGSAIYPEIILTSLSTVNIDVAPRSGDIQQVSVQAQNVAAKGKTWATVFSFETVGTTVKDAAKATDQAAKIAARIDSKEAKPDLVIFNTASPINTVPGDTVTYTITYCNIGNALAQDAEITNPVADGVMLIENSIGSKDAAATIDRKPSTSADAGAPALVRWKITKKIMPGEEGTLTMKVVVR
jgi:uncharacterized repeat protein (TIGR01451 family)